MLIFNFPYSPSKRYILYKFSYAQVYFSQHRNSEQSRSSWCSLMLYQGGLTFYPGDPAKYLKISNRIAEMRIARAILDKYGLRDSLVSMLDSIISDGNIQPVLSCYRDLMVQRDIGYRDFNKSEEIHRDSFFFSLLRNFSLLPTSGIPVDLGKPRGHQCAATSPGAHPELTPTR